jgi:hypothetical protein
MIDANISRFIGVSISFVVNNAFHQIILYGIHILCNLIGGIFITAAIMKLNFISPGVQN